MFFYFLFVLQDLIQNNVHSRHIITYKLSAVNLVRISYHSSFWCHSNSDHFRFNRNVLFLGINVIWSPWLLASPRKSSSSCTLLRWPRTRLWHWRTIKALSQWVRKFPHQTANSMRFTSHIPKLVNFCG